VTVVAHPEAGIAAANAEAVASAEAAAHPAAVAAAGIDRTKI